jgi:response regulator RpfG family c-di-GMP phosphodiesterase
VSAERVLIVDDDSSVREICEQILRRRGFLVISAKNSGEALQHARSTHLDLLLIDISIPKMNGVELIEQIREIHAEIAAVVMTGYGTLDNVIRSFKLGAQGFVVKPFSNEDLLMTVEEALEKYRLSKENMRLRLLMPLFELNRNLVHEVDLENLFNTIVRVTLRETRSDVVALMLVDEETGKLKSRAWAVSSPNILRNKGLETFESRVAGRVVGSKEPLVLVDEFDAMVPMKESEGAEAVSSAVSMPLLNNNSVIGVLNLSKLRDKPPYNQSDLELISVLCGQAAIAVENVRFFEALQEAHFDSVKALTQAIEAKDRYTAGHCDRLVDYAVAIGKRLGLTEQERQYLKFAATLHDIGKIAVNEAILNKQGKLTETEYREMMTHPARGASIIRDVKFLKPVVPMIYHHQERWDGLGYPKGLKGEDIPLGARIVAVLDTFDAMTSNRPYRKALPVDAAIAELRQFSGSQFDPVVVDAFIDVLKCQGIPGHV